MVGISFQNVCTILFYSSLLMQMRKQKYLVLHRSILIECQLSKKGIITSCLPLVIIIFVAKIKNNSAFVMFHCFVNQCSCKILPLTAYHSCVNLYPFTHDDIILPKWHMTDFSPNDILFLLLYSCSIVQIF